MAIILFLTFYPKITCHPESEKPEPAEVWRNEGSPSHSRNLYNKDVYKD
jgi:hypothetical protein